MAVPFFKPKVEYITEPCETSPTKAHHWLVPMQAKVIEKPESICKYCKRKRFFELEFNPSNVNWRNSSGMQPKTPKGINYVKKRRQAK